jgi:myo-inositol-1(or 4)-monophosphatase
VDLVELVGVARRAVVVGVELVRGGAREVRLKGDRDVVTEVDVAVERAVRAFLLRETPGVGFLGEEDGGASLTDSVNDVWTLDPVDGTSNFAHNIPLCAVSLALIRDGEPVVAAIDAPFLDLRYHAAKGHGAFCNNNRINASTRNELSRAIVSIGDYAVGEGAAEKNRTRLNLTARLAERIERVRMWGTAALDLAWVAEGRTDATIILSNDPWDTSAGVLLAREAGASVVDRDGARHNVASKETIAAPPQLIDDILELVNGS